MTLTLPLSRSSGAFASSSLRQAAAAAASWRQHYHRLLQTTATSTITSPYIQSQRVATRWKTTNPASSFHTSAAQRSDKNGSSEQPPPTDFGALDVLANTPVPSTSVDICMSSGFQLNNGTRVTDGSGILLVGGEAFSWRPWEVVKNDRKNKNHNNHHTSNNKVEGEGPRLVNKRGQWDVEASTLGLLGVVWPRPDLLVLGLGPEMRPISPELRKAISALGMRVEVLDTRNAAAQFNLLATERGVDDVAAALIPIGWREGVGAGTGDEPDITHE